MINANILAEILVLKRYKKKGFGEKSLFDLLINFKNSQYLDLFSYLFEFMADYGFSEEEIQKLSKESALYEDAKKIIAICKDLNIQISTCLDENYPSIFCELRSLPIFFYKGDLSLLSGRNIAIVGTRNPTSYGINITERIVKTIGNNANIVSGGAIGIDTVAHSSAIRCSKTIVFFGTSIDKPYPSNNIPLFNKIIEAGGLVISAFGPLEETNEFTFVNSKKVQELKKFTFVN
jgi:DNA processing protein